MHNNSPIFEYPSDFYPGALKRGTRYFGYYRVPWKARPHIVKVDGRPYPFDTEFEALVAATKVLCTMFRDKTMGCIYTDNPSAKEEAEKLFAKEKS